MFIIKIKNQTIGLLSDTHGKHRLIDIPRNIDIVIHCGDICKDGNLEEIIDFFEWYSALEIPTKLFVHGNHDLPFELDPEESKNLIPRNVIWLNDSSININEILIKAVSPFFFFNKVEFNEKVDILLSHYPPEGILDDGFGIKELWEYTLDLKPDYHVFGHNHSGTGTLKIGNTQFINASLYEELKAIKKLKTTDFN